ncbi:hypothetical protein [Candidatus Harpocratesius sp.]
MSEERKKIIDFEKIGQDFEEFVNAINPFKNLNIQFFKNTKSQSQDSTQPLESSQIISSENEMNDAWLQFSQKTQNSLEQAQEERFLQEEKRLAKRVKNKKIFERRHKRLILRQKRDRRRIKAFFEHQQEEFRQKLKEIEQDRRKKRQQVRQIEKKTLQETRLQNEAILQENRELQQKIREHRRALRIKRRAARKARRQMAVQMHKEYISETQQIRQQNWERFIRRQRRQTERFVKFSNRLWWQGYISLLAWIVGIFLILMAIFYIFKALGVNLFDLISNTEIFIPLGSI